MKIYNNWITAFQSSFSAMLIFDVIFLNQAFLSQFDLTSFLLWKSSNHGQLRYRNCSRKQYMQPLASNLGKSADQKDCDNVFRRTLRFYSMHWNLWKFSFSIFLQRKLLSQICATVNTTHQKKPKYFLKMPIPKFFVYEFRDCGMRMTT